MIFNDWHEVEQYVDSSTLHITPSYLDRVNTGKYPKDAFTLGQLASKAWLVDQTVPLLQHKERLTIAILGCWVGALVQPLYKSLLDERIQRIYGIDVDPDSVELSEQFNQRLVQDNWKYKGVVADCSTLCCGNMEFMTGGELITVTPDVVINTSCEHMDTEWFHSCATGQLVVMQTNNSDLYDGHINTCASVNEMQEKYPLTEILYAGSMETPAYTRFMQIGVI